MFNKKYARGSIYGAGAFPFWLYVKYFGKPMYKLGQRWGFNKYFSLMLAHILGALAHVAFFIPGFSPILIGGFIISLLVFPLLFLRVSKGRERKIYSKI